MKTREPSLKEALICFILIIVTIAYMFKLKAGMEMPLIMATTIAALFGIYLKKDWNYLQSGMIDGIKNGIMCYIILLLAGMLVGIWIIGGTVPSIIFYGLKLLNPKIFLPFTFVLCAVVSLATGTSFGSIATVGLALFGVGQGLGIPGYIIAGAIASGAFLGDKVSPLSDTSVAAATMCDVNIFEHVKSTIYTTSVAAILSLFIYIFYGLKYSNGEIDSQSIDTIMTTLSTNFNISIWSLLPPLIIIVLSILKIPSVLALGCGVIISVIFAFVSQNIAFKDILIAATRGYTSQTGVILVDKILSRGGMLMMSSTIIMIMAATAMGGLLNKCNVLNVILGSLLKFIKSPKQLIILSVFSGYVSQLIAPTMMFGIVMVGETLTPAFKKMNIHPKVLSRTIGDTITLGNVLIPWGGASLYLQGVLDINASYIPYTFVSILSPFIAIGFAYLGVGIWSYKNANSYLVDKI